MSEHRCRVEGTVTQHHHDDAKHVDELDKLCAVVVEFVSTLNVPEWVRTEITTSIATGWLRAQLGMVLRAVRARVLHDAGQPTPIVETTDLKRASSDAVAPTLPTLPPGVRARTLTQPYGSMPPAASSAPTRFPKPPR